MSDFVSRIGLGCSRLAGGVAERGSRRLIDTAIACGVRYFDTAPSYGGGRSEEVLGRALVGMQADVRVCTKVGLARAVPTLKAEARSLLVGTVRRLMPSGVIARLRRHDPAVRQGGERHYGRFEPGFVRESLERSSAALRSDRLDAVLLHEPRLSDPPVETRELLEAMQARHAIGQLGAGTAQAAGELPRFGTVAQCTVDVSLPADGREWIVHGLLREFDPSALRAALAASGLSGILPAVDRYTTSAQQGAGLLLCAVLLGIAPARVLLSTHSPARLKSLLAEGAALFDELTGQPPGRVTAPLAQLARHYFAGRRSVS